MANKVGRPKGTNNKDYNYTLRLDAETRKRLEAYCEKLHVTRSEFIRDAINHYDIEEAKNDVKN